MCKQSPIPKVPKSEKSPALGYLCDQDRSLHARGWESAGLIAKDTQRQDRYL